MKGSCSPTALLPGTRRGLPTRGLGGARSTACVYLDESSVGREGGQGRRSRTSACHRIQPSCSACVRCSSSDPDDHR